MLFVCWFFDTRKNLYYLLLKGERFFLCLIIDYFLFKGYENTEKFKLKIKEQDLFAEYLDPRIKKFDRKNHLISLIKKYANNHDKANGIIVYLDIDNGRYKLKYSSLILKINIEATESFSKKTDSNYKKIDAN